MQLNDIEVKTRVRKLSDIIRAEYIDDVNYLELYAGEDIIESINNIKNQVIYGRRGTGKTHLFRAFQETLIESFATDERMPIYIDLRRLLPLMSTINGNNTEYSILLFKHIVNEIFEVLTNNINFIYNINNFRSASQFSVDKKRELEDRLKELNIHFDGKEYRKFQEVELTEEEIHKLATSLNVSKDAGGSISGAKEQSISKKTKNTKYVSFADISYELERIPELLGIKRVICMLDEWSEIPIESQLFLAEILKRA